MKKLLLAAAALICALLAVTPASAQALRTFVSGTGNDANPCSRAAPCKTFQGAISQTAPRGEINCLDAGGYGTVVITKEITIDCTGTFGGILSSGLDGVVINIAGGAVALKGITIDGTGSGRVGVRIIAASKVNLHNVDIFSCILQGVLDARTAPGGVLVIENSTIKNNEGAGITSVSASNAILLDNVISKQNLYGIVVSNGISASVTRSTISNNVNAGAQVVSGGQLYMTDSLLTFNATGLQVDGTAAIANTSIVFNPVGLSGGGTITSFGNNRIYGNTSAGKAVVAAGAASSDLGQK